MFSYFGSKSKIAKYYPKPLYNTIIEPFAGSAQYSCLYSDRNIILYDTYYIITGIWKYLIQATKQDILNIPDNCDGGLLLGKDYFSSCLVAFCSNRGSTKPRFKAPKGLWNTWNKQKIKIANFVDKINHWEIMCDSYETIDIDQPVTWFIDPPYQKQGHLYSNNSINYQKLRNWIDTLRGQVIVCENEDSNWIPLTPLKKMRGLKYTKMEMMYYKENANNHTKD